MMRSSWKIEVPNGFQLSTAVCSYGWALLAPNRWERSTKSGSGDPITKEGNFKRGLHSGKGCINVTISQDTANSLEIKLGENQADETDRSSLNAQIKRMLRLSSKDSEVVSAFQAVHDQAKDRNFGRLFRSPSVWEDLAKCILLCNCGWGRTVSMNAALCEKYGQGGFPTPSQIAGIKPEELQANCGVGYRAKNIVNLAQQIQSGAICPEDLENEDLSDEELYKSLKKLPGVGPFSAANMLQLLGRYERIACDSETIRHLKAYHKTMQCNSANCEEIAAKIYSKYAPFQFLAYWFELWHSYENLLGPFSELDPELYKSFTGHNMRRGSVLATTPHTKESKTSKSRESKRSKSESRVERSEKNDKELRRSKRLCKHEAE